jgi:AraC-like DNA-binding protein
MAAVESILAFAEAHQVGTAAALTRDLRIVLPAARADARVPSTLIPRLLAAAAFLLREPNLGLRLAATGDPRRHGLLDYLAATSPTLGAAWSQICRYLALWNEGVAIRQSLGPTEVALELRLSPAADEPEGVRQLLGLAAATLVLAGHRYAGRPVPPRYTELACEAPADPAQWAATLGAPVSFAVPLTRIVYPPQTAVIVGATSDGALARILGRHADELLARLGDKTSWSGKVRDAILAELRRGEVHLSVVATAVVMSERTLQRRLRDEGTSFEEVLDQTRFALASSYLRDPALGIAEVAWLTGYTEIATFYRAFRRWTGSTPATYRAHLA